MSNSVFNFNFLALLLSEILGGPKFTLGGPTPPGRPQRRNFCTQSEYFTIFICVFYFNILALVVSEILGGSQIYVKGPCAPLYAPQRKFFVPLASTSLCLMPFLISTKTPPNKEIFVPKASSSQIRNIYFFLISTFQLQQFPRFQGVPNLRQGACAPCTLPSGDFFVPQASLMAFFNFNFLAHLLFEILGGSQIYTRGPYAPWTPPNGENFVRKASTHNV